MYIYTKYIMNGDDDDEDDEDDENYDDENMT